MNETELKQSFAEMVDQIAGFFSRKTEEKGKEFLKDHCNGVLKEITQMDEILKDYPIYAAIAFLGRFNFADCPEVDSLVRESSPQILEAIRQKKAITIIGADAQEKWVYVRDNFPDTACAILSLCLLSGKSTKTKKRIPEYYEY